MYLFYKYVYTTYKYVYPTFQRRFRPRRGPQWAWGSPRNKMGRFIFGEIFALRTEEADILCKILL